MADLPRRRRRLSRAVVGGLGLGLIVGLGWWALADRRGGVSDAGDDPAFASCVREAGSSLDGSADWDGQRQLEFWARPGTLACAVSELDRDALAEALEAAFLDPEDADDYVATAQGKQVALRTLAADVASTEGEDRALRAVAEVVRVAGWDEVVGTWGARRVAAMSIVEATDGLPGYADYLRSTEQEDVPASLFNFFDHALDEEGPPPAWTSRVEELTSEIWDLSVAGS